MAKKSKYRKKNFGRKPHPPNPPPPMWTILGNVFKILKNDQTKRKYELLLMEYGACATGYHMVERKRMRDIMLPMV